MKTFSAYKLNLDGSLTHRENLNNLDELNAWMWKVYGKFATIQITCDQTGKSVIRTDNGKDWEK